MGRSCGAPSLRRRELVCYDLTAADAERLIDAGLLPWIRGLEIRGASAGGLRTLGKHPAAAGIRTLAVHGSDGDGGGLVAEAGWLPHWAGLRSLQLRQMWLEPTAAGVLFRAAHLRSLTTLWVDGRGWSVETVQALTETAFPILTDLPAHPLESGRRRGRRCWRTLHPLVRFAISTWATTSSPAVGQPLCSVPRISRAWRSSGWRITPFADWIARLKNPPSAGCGCSTRTAANSP